MFSQNYPHVTLTILRAIPFVGTISFMPAIAQFSLILKKYPHHKILARGPLAGYIALKSMNTRCMQCIIQARGLLAEEYRYTHAQTAFHTLRAHWYEKLEKYVYATKSPRVTIEAVSPALAEFLHKNYSAEIEKIILAEHDRYTPLTAAEKTVFKAAIRKKLAIPEHAYVFCYAGSAHAWQCSRETLNFFLHSARTNKFLLIMTREKEFFENLCAEYRINTEHYRVITVGAQEVIHYLAACDAGILFREPHILNWVSRPTKALEYHAAGLEIIHNDTVAFMKELGK